MTFQELLKTCTFKEIHPKLVEISHPDGEYSMGGFKTVFDELRLRKSASPADCKITISENPAEEDIPAYIRVSSDSGSLCYYPHWDEILGWEIVVDENIHLSNAETAAHIIWEMTFYGYSEKEINDRFSRMFNRSNTAEDNEEQHIMDLKKKLYGKRNKQCMNRSKKKREYRWERRIEQLEYNRSIDKIVRKYTGKTDIERFTCLYNAQSTVQHPIFTAIANRTDRAQYVVEIFTDYPLCNYNEFTHFYFLFTSPSACEITDEEKETLLTMRSLLPAGANILYAYTTDDSPGENIEMLLIASKPANPKKNKRYFQLQA
jgi:hypothetical protein